MHKGDSNKGWTAYTHNIKKEIDRPLTDKEYSQLLLNYIRGVKWETSVKEIAK